LALRTHAEQKYSAAGLPTFPTFDEAAHAICGLSEYDGYLRSRS
jgi:hypothetical protein